MKIQELLCTPDHWTQGMMARDSKGERASANSSEATCWCLYGAMVKCYEYLGEVRGKIKNAFQAKGIYLTIPGFNDSVTYEDVIALVKELDL